MRVLAYFTGAVLLIAAVAFADLTGIFEGGLDHPAIEYSGRPLHDPIAALNDKTRDGSVQLRFDDRQGYLRSVLEALRVPVESQMMAFSKTSVQAPLINPQNPRSLFFNDSVVIGWVRGGMIEAAALDPRQGVHFYTLHQVAVEKPGFQREDGCLSCHDSLAAAGVPGMLLRSVFTAPNGHPMQQYGNYVTDHRSPMEQRWAGWYVTGKLGVNKHLGNAMVTDPENPESMVTPETINVESLRDKFDASAYLSPYSDVAALMVFEHQMRMINLLVRVGWEVRYAVHESDGDAANVRTVLRDSARELVDYLLFVDEAPLHGPIAGTSGFAEKFAAQGSMDSKGRSLRQLDLNRRLMKYPCSYMIYSEAFDSLPTEARAAIYSRMWQILSGQETAQRYARLSNADRKAILEILRETKTTLPAYFRTQ